MILVTGAAGFIGSNFVHYYLDAHPDGTIIGYDNLTYAGNPDNLTGTPKDRFVFIRGDVCDRARLDRVFREYPVDGVIHFAAESHVDRSITDPQLFLRSNILGTCTLLDAARAHWKDDLQDRTFLQVSTDEVYGSLGSTGYFTEETPLDPHSPYSASKASADLMAGAYHDTFGLPVVITRCSNNYGPYQFPEKLIPLIITNALDHQPLPVYGDGRQVRDWLYVEDHCRAIDAVFAAGKHGEVYNIGGNNEQENIEIVRLVIDQLRELTGDENITKDLIRHVTDRPGHDRRYAIDSSKIQKELGWKPKTPFTEGIQKTIRWYLQNKPWIERIKTGKYQRFYEENDGDRT